MSHYFLGDQVRLVCDLYNDGTHLDRPRGGLLHTAGAVGQVVRQGFFLQEPVYDVCFEPDQRTSGCREWELIPLEQPWSPPLFKEGDQVQARCALSQKGQILVEAGEKGWIKKSLYDPHQGYVYVTLFPCLEQGKLLLSSQQIHPCPAQP